MPLIFPFSLIYLFVLVTLVHCFILQLYISFCISDFSCFGLILMIGVCSIFILIGHSLVYYHRYLYQLCFSVAYDCASGNNSSKNVWTCDSLIRKLLFVLQVLAVNIGSFLLWLLLCYSYYFTNYLACSVFSLCFSVLVIALFIAIAKSLRAFLMIV